MLSIYADSLFQGLNQPFESGCPIFQLSIFLEAGPLSHYKPVLTVNWSPSSQLPACLASCLDFSAQNLSLCFHTWSFNISWTTTEIMSFTQLLSVYLGVTSLVCLLLEGRMNIVMHPFFFLLLHLFCLFVFVFWRCHVACGILVPRPGMELMLLAV